MSAANTQFFLEVLPTSSLIFVSQIFFLSLRIPLRSCTAIFYIHLLINSMFVVVSHFMLVTVTGWQSEKPKSVEFWGAAARAVKTVKSSTFFLCGDWEKFKEAW